MTRAIGRAFLRLSGWRVEGAALPPGKVVVIGAPHTSNWDFPPTLAIFWSVGLNVKFLAKASLFWFPLGSILRALGGIPVDRSQRNDLVAQAASQLLAHEGPLGLVVPVEGTRAKTEYWKSGFLHIARAAKIPIVLGYLDFVTKRGGFGPTLPSDQPAHKIMDAARQFYADKHAKIPANVGPVRLRDEEHDA